MASGCSVLAYSGSFSVPRRKLDSFFLYERQDESIAYRLYSGKDLASHGFIIAWLVIMTFAIICDADGFPFRASFAHSFRSVALLLYHLVHRLHLDKVRSAPSSLLFFFELSFSLCLLQAALQGPYIAAHAVKMLVE